MLSHVPSVMFFSLLVPLMNYCEDHPWPPQVFPMSRFYLTSLCRFASQFINCPFPKLPVSGEGYASVHIPAVPPTFQFSVCACLLFLVCKYERDFFPYWITSLKSIKRFLKSLPQISLWLSWYLTYSLISIFFLMNKWMIPLILVPSIESVE